MDKVTKGQASVLRAIEIKPLTAVNIKVRLNGFITKPWTYDRVHSILRRLEDRGLVRRTYGEQSNVAVWELTVLGRKALEV